MKRFFVLAITLTALSFAAAQRTHAADTTTAPPAGTALPAGWSADELQAVVAAGTPGEMHALLHKSVGNWKCHTQMWMAPDSEPLAADGTTKVSSLLDGRFILVEMQGEMPGMGHYVGNGVYGFDNVSQQFVANWIDNSNTGMMRGVGKLSDDGQQLTWEFVGNCPRTKQPITMRDVETFIDPNTKRLESFAKDPKSGVEFKMMQIDMTRD